jgi:hypothetical protein
MASLRFKRSQFAIDESTVKRQMLYALLDIDWRMVWLINRSWTGIIHHVSLCVGRSRNGS